MRVQFHRDGEKVAVVGRNEITFYSVHRPLSHRELDSEMAGSARYGIFSPNGRWLAISGGYDGFAIWDLNADGPALRVREPKIMTPFFSPDSSEIYATWEYGIARWRLGVGNEASPQLEPLPVHQPRLVLGGAFSGDSLVLGTSPGVVLLSPNEIASGPGTLEETGTAPNRVSPDGRGSVSTKAIHRKSIFTSSGPGTGCGLSRWTPMSWPRRLPLEAMNWQCAPSLP
jgi:hypothetical protein